MQPTASNPASIPAAKPAFLEIKNWAKFQKPNTTQWIKDYTNREDDREFGKLTLFQRGLLEGICRLRARQARPVPNDPAYISRALQIIDMERRCVPQALKALTASGFLIPLPDRETTVTEAWTDRDTTVSIPWHDREHTVTPQCDVLDPQNQLDDFSKSPRLDEIREEESTGDENSNFARSLKSDPTPRASGQKKRLKDFPRVMETREEREEFRAGLLEMREAVNTTPVRKMDVDTERGDVSELDAIPELDLATIPELDLINIPEWTA